MSILAAIIAGALAFMVGALWYTVLFGKLWQREVGITDEQIKAAGSLSSVFIVTKTVSILILILLSKKCLKAVSKVFQMVKGIQLLNL
ncbi:DUF1761 family protein [Macrococcoides bohemicum]|nr:DUF1761 family protein [Macrococcus bohemicus]MBC9874531.1 DUF1761 family protein [Macrococcus bohemicus]QRN49015.1 DUF1761 family protein [Macrococcus bohemicus]QYA45151.1 DUF1761 domain-containing protein [Macrococcus bohemicus]